MKLSKERENIRKISLGDLEKMINSLRRELFDLRLNASTAHVKDYSQFGKLRRKVARVLGELNMRLIEQKMQNLESR